MTTPRKRLEARLAVADQFNNRLKNLTYIAVGIEDLRALLSEREVGREALIRLANAADHYGIANLDTDDLDEEAEDLQAATEVARKALSLLGGE